jgi:hypothetical protein
VDIISKLEPMQTRDAAAGQVVAACYAVRAELNDRLALISATATLLSAEGSLPPRLRSSAERILAEAEAARKLAGQLLTVACPHADEAVARD